MELEESPFTLIGSQPTCEQKIAATQSHPAKVAQCSTAIDTHDEQPNCFAFLTRNRASKIRVGSVCLPPG